jgi:DNA-binding LacI/PurR family transcriptional regulator/DNA-binding transcriptional regulator YhcF (GntR family)
MPDKLAVRAIASQPTTKWLTEQLRHAIAEGEFPPHAPMPSYRDMALRHGVSLWTVRMALDALEKEGLVVRHERRGTFAQRPPASGHLATSLRCVNIVEFERRPDQREGDFIRSACLVGYTQALEHTDVKLRFASLSPDETDFGTILSPLLPYEAQGCILHQVFCPELFEWLHRAGIPFVVQYAHAYARNELPDHHKVFPNKTRGAFDATHYLADLGHRRIAFMGELARPDCIGPPPCYDGYRSALAYSGIEPASGDVVEFSADDPDVAREPARAFLTRADLPTAILTQTDSMAIALINEARSLGIRIPAELSIVGMNDQAESAFTDPPLTTVAIPRRQVAAAAIEMLLGAARGKFEEFQTRVLDCRLVSRESVGLPRQVGVSKGASCKERVS